MFHSIRLAMISEQIMLVPPINLKPKQWFVIELVLRTSRHVKLTVVSISRHHNVIKSKRANHLMCPCEIDLTKQPKYSEINLLQCEVWQWMEFKTHQNMVTLIHTLLQTFFDNSNFWLRPENKADQMKFFW